LGGIATSNPSKFEEISKLKFGVENKINLRSMLDHNLEAEKEVIREIREKIKFTNENQDYATEHLFKDIFTRQVEIAHELDRYLKNESFEVNTECKCPEYNTS
jgi:DNA-binding ferritin-like protein